MILQLWTELKKVEATAKTVCAAACKAYDAAVEACAPLPDIGPHHVALGATRAAIMQVERILGPAAVADAQKALTAAQAAETEAAAAEAKVSS